MFLTYNVSGAAIQFAYTYKLFLRLSFIIDFIIGCYKIFTIVPCAIQLTFGAFCISISLKLEL